MSSYRIEPGYGGNPVYHVTRHVTDAEHRAAMALAARVGPGEHWVLYLDTPRCAALSVWFAVADLGRVVVAPFARLVRW